jgi:hypothetical protein
MWRGLQQEHGKQSLMQSATILWHKTIVLVISTLQESDSFRCFRNSECVRAARVKINIFTPCTKSRAVRLEKKFGSSTNDEKPMHDNVKVHLAEKEWPSLRHPQKTKANKEDALVSSLAGLSDRNLSVRRVWSRTWRCNMLRNREIDQADPHAPSKGRGRRQGSAVEKPLDF